MIDIEKLAVDVNIATEKLKQFAEAYASELKADNENLVRINNLQAQEIVELQANINDLREALEEMVAMEELEGNSYEPQRHILSKTPAQSLQEHDNEVIEKCAEVIDEMIIVYTKNCERYKVQGDDESVERSVNKGRAAISCAEAIRALKHTS